MTQSTSYIIKKSHKSILLAFIGITCTQVASADATDNEIVEEIQRCYIEQIQVSDENRTVGEIEVWCRENAEFKQQQQEHKLSPLKKRLRRESANKDNPNVITSHKRNYLLPFTYTNNPNSEPYNDLTDGNPLDNFEAKFQLSFKAPIAESILQDNDMLFFGFTI